MINYTTGDLFQSEAQALVNTVNCEGFMGKGLALGFKDKFPENHNAYVDACRCGLVRPGKVFIYDENGKIIVNFPTKDKWREKSRIEDIKAGLDDLCVQIRSRTIKSIALPPLGCGNGGLIWPDVKDVIEEKLDAVAQGVDVTVFAPIGDHSSNTYVRYEESIKKNVNLVLIDIMLGVQKQSGVRIQKAAYFAESFSKKKAFAFQLTKDGPFDQTVRINKNAIMQYQKRHSMSTAEVRDMLKSTQKSKAADEMQAAFAGPVERACAFVNSIENEGELDFLAVVFHQIDKGAPIAEEDILRSINDWAMANAKRFEGDRILGGINQLFEAGMIERNLYGYQVRR